MRLRASSARWRRARSLRRSPATIGGADRPRGISRLLTASTMAGKAESIKARTGMNRLSPQRSRWGLSKPDRVMTGLPRSCKRLICRAIGELQGGCFQVFRIFRTVADRLESAWSPKDDDPGTCRYRSTVRAGPATRMARRNGPARGLSPFRGRVATIALDSSQRDGRSYRGRRPSPGPSRACLDRSDRVRQPFRGGSPWQK
jgi:hypothetical protein